MKVCVPPNSVQRHNRPLEIGIRITHGVQEVLGDYYAAKNALSIPYGKVNRRHYSSMVLDIPKSVIAAVQATVIHMLNWAPVIPKYAIFSDVIVLWRLRGANDPLSTVESENARFTFLMWRQYYLGEVRVSGSATIQQTVQKRFKDVDSLSEPWEPAESLLNLNRLWRRLTASSSFGSTSFVP